MSKKINTAIFILACIAVLSSFLSSSISTALAIGFFTYWACFSQKKVFTIIGNVCLIASMVGNTLNLPHDFLGVLLYILNIMPFLASIFLLVAFCFKKRHKSFLIVPILVIGFWSLVLGMLALFALFNMMKNYDIWSFSFITSTYILRDISLLISAVYLFVLAVYILKDGKPSPKTVKNQHYISEASAPLSLADQLNEVKLDYKAGKITEEEYKKRRMEILTKQSV